MPTSDARGSRGAPARPSTGRAVGLVLLIWAVAVAFVLEVASDTRIGPVVYSITRTHGVHLGDVYATLGCGAVALLLSIWVITDHRGRARRYERYQQRRQAAEAAGIDPAIDPGYDDEIDPDEQETMIVKAPLVDDDPAYDDRYDDAYDGRYDDEYDAADVDRPAARHRYSVPPDDGRSGQEATQEIPRGRHARFE